VWSHADAERSAAIRRTLEANRSRKESAQSLVTTRLKSLRADAQDPTIQARRNSKRGGRGPWTTNGATTDGETDIDGETDGGVSESDYEVGSRLSHNPGESTLFLPGDTVFWLPYALSKSQTVKEYNQLSFLVQPSYPGIRSMTLCATI